MYENPLLLLLQGSGVAPMGPLGESDVELSNWKGEFTWGKEELGHTGKGNLNADIKDFYFCRSPGISLHFLTRKIRVRYFADPPVPPPHVLRGNYDMNRYEKFYLS